MATYSQLNTNVQSQCGAQLRTFDRYVGFYIRTYVRATFFESGNAYHPPANSYDVYNWSYHRFEYVNAPTSLYNGYLAGGIYTGNIIYQNDVINSISNVVRRTVDVIEGRITDRTSDMYYCHASCHSSCHSSRGRR